MISVRHRTGRNRRAARDAWPAMLVAVAITATSLALLLDAMARRGTWRIGLSIAGRPPVSETVTFVTPLPIVPRPDPVPRMIARRTRTLASPSTQPLRPRVGPVDTGATPAPVATEQR